MSRTSASEIAHKQQIEALQMEKQQLEEALLRLKRDKFALAEKLHLQEDILHINRSGLFEWKIGAEEFYLQFPWKKILGEHTEQGKNMGRLLEVILPAHRFRVKRMLWELVHAVREQHQLKVQMANANPSVQLLIKAALVYDENKKPLSISGTLLVLEEESFTDQTKDVSLLDDIAVAIIKTSFPEGKISYLNRQAIHLLDTLGSGSLDKSDMKEWMGEEQWQSFSEKLREDQYVEYWLFSPEEKKHWHINAQLSEQDIFLLILDVSEQEQTLQGLQKVNFDLDNFVYHASHDLRAPLRTVLGMLGILKSETNKEQRKRCVDLIEGSIRRLDALVIDLLSISRNNRTHNTLIRINFMVEVNQAVSSFYHVGNTKNLEITTKISQPVHFVADLTRVRIVLNNLISNAIKYRRYYLDRSFVDIRIWVDEKAAHIEIEDNGEGIPEDRLPFIYDMFYRASERSEGSGLGLYIVKDVLQKLEGTIEVDSTFDKGTTFTISIPNKYQ
ncbi:sensor histidine kinase [Catalinimonas niigatensis]|uniref:sensor histidine kinase n=1 Tax=Catalinimonas niigatensis TaxID=1397264 RepID=UPI002665BF32|nr:HAMP domain-containing sensor histidine kinase [Catalinimonas niigatensis]WPP52607.1 HAMP domain-containing sensor histidine kinase [Catalinimonas niigatensis]